MQKFVLTKKLVSTITACAVAAMLTSSPRAVAADSAKSGAAVAFAKVDLSDGTLKTFGGKGTKSASITDNNSPYSVEVTFVGKYSKTITADKVVINATCESDDYGVANAYVSSVSPTNISITVYGWVSDTREYNGERVFFSVFVGQ
jgi:ABC-type proline/glycine betaine transport system substrate-binding protein